MAEPRRAARHNHLTLARRVLTIALEQGLKRGDHLAEQNMSDACSVSRTPIRGAFRILEENGFLEWREEEGYFLLLDGADELADAAQRLDEVEDGLASRILSDRAQRRIGDIHSISALARRYNASRSSVQVALKILSQDGIVTQLPGRAWVFQPMLDSPAAIEESLAMRRVMEPQAILAPGFALDRTRAEMMRTRMEEIMRTPAGRITAQSFLRIDTEFHSLIADGSGNRFLRGALQSHHRLRRATLKDTSIPDFRLRQSLEEHLDILDSLEKGQVDLAAEQMGLHLLRSRIRRPEAANRGIAPLLRGRTR